MRWPSDSPSVLLVVAVRHGAAVGARSCAGAAMLVALFRVTMRLILAIGLALATGACRDEARPAEEPVAEHHLALSVAVTTGPVPYVYRAGLHDLGTYGTGPLTDLKLGVVREDLGWDVTVDATSMSDYLQRLDAHLAGQRAKLSAILEAGGELTVLVSFTPRWLSSCSSATEVLVGSGWPRWASCPPTDLAAWSAFVEATVRAYSAAGFAPRWEVWNEPNLEIFWNPDVSRATAAGRDATLDSYFQLYRATVVGARRADPSALVGGPTIAGLDEWVEGGAPETGFMARFIARAGATASAELGLARVPIDFVVWHDYDVQPRFAGARVPLLRDWLASAGYPRTTTLLIDEWNANVGGWPFEEVPAAERPFKVQRNDSEYDASYAAATLMAYGAAGLDRHSFSSVGEQAAGPPEFHGDQGIRTTNGARKPVYFGLQAMSALAGREVALQLTGPSPFLSARASVAPDGVVLVIANHVTERDLAVTQTLHYGATPALVAEAATFGAEELKAVVNGDRDPATLGVSAELAELLTQARSARVASETWSARPAEVEIELSDLPADRLLTETQQLVDAAHSNAFRAYRQSLAAGAGEAAAAQAARDAGIFEIVATRRREATPRATLRVVLQPYSVLLVRWTD